MGVRFLSSSVRESSELLKASCTRQPRPQASTAHGGDCEIAAQSSFANSDGLYVGAT